MDNEEIINLMAEKIVTLNARLDAQQAVLVATMAALAKSSAKGGAQIEQMALSSSENLCRLQEARGVPASQTDQVRKHVETILLTVRAATTGKPR